jgi:hypothetical protein
MAAAAASMDILLSRVAHAASLRISTDITTKMYTARMRSSVNDCNAVIRVLVLCLYALVLL